MQVEQAIQYAMETGPQLSEDQLLALEAKLGHQLPEDYRHYLLSVNGGFYGGLAVYYSSNAENEDSFDTPLHHIYGFQEEACINIDEIYSDMKRKLPDGHIAIMDDVFGNQIVLAVTGENRGSVYFLDHESGRWDRASSKLAASFTDFIRQVEWEE